MNTYMVAGSGLSGISAVGLLLRVGQQVVLYDKNESLSVQELRRKVKETGEVSEAAMEGFSVILGELTVSRLQELDVAVCVVSPGIPLEEAFLDVVRAAEIPVIGEIELAYCFGRGEVIGITGTNGKTTTTTLVGEIMKRSNPETFVVGNIGLPYSQKADSTTDDSVVVAEISSFMLETITSFRPHVSAILNITPDHLNRHKTMEQYIAMKERIAQYQTAEDTCILNYHDLVLRGWGQQLSCQVIFFSSQETLKQGLFLRDDDIVLRRGSLQLPGLPEDIGEEVVVCRTDEMHLIGVHNYENVCAAIGIALAMGVSLEVIRETIREFRAVEHRIEYVRTVNGVKYYNDSKGTNPDAAIQAIRAMKAPTVLIGGGYDKQSEYDEWIAAFEGKVKCLLLMGATKEKIRDAAYAQGFEACRFVNSMEEAVAAAADLALPGENVLLSPACASWGMFENFEQRGRVFKDLVNRL